MGKFSDITKFMLFNLYIGYRIDYTGIRNGIYINGGFSIMKFGSQKLKKKFRLRLVMCPAGARNKIFIYFEVSGKALE